MKSLSHSFSLKSFQACLKADTTLLVRMDITLQNIKRLFLPFLSKMLICKPVLYEKKGLEKEIHIFEKKKEVRIKKEGSAFFFHF